MLRKWLPWLVGAIVLVGLVGWGVRSLTNLPGEAVEDMGRDHLSREELSRQTYNSNPPTSGPHDPDWIRPGVYEIPQDKYKLIHSLEHGYIVVHYNCGLLNPKSEFRNPKQLPNFSMIQTVVAHEDEGDLDDDEATDSSSLGPSTSSSDAECELAKILADFKAKIDLPRIIVNPNPEIDKPVVLTAWGRILKLESWDEAAATKFARAYHNKGPEATME